MRGRGKLFCGGCIFLLTRNASGGNCYLSTRGSAPPQGNKQMTNFAKQMEAAIATYAELSGLTVAAIVADCADTNSQAFRIVSMLMFAAR